MKDQNLKQLAEQIKRWGADLGFAHTAISDIDLSQSEHRLAQWLANKFHGEMTYMSVHGAKRSRPAELVPATLRIITVRMDYLNEEMQDAEQVLNQPDKAYISRYALGRDYHKVIRSRLQKLANKISGAVGEFGYRAFCDSAPVMEKALAEKSGQGWLGKHTNIINREQGSWFFLGELYTDIPLPVDEAATNHCGSCQACIEVCPTDAIVAPYQLDARRCISYLTIELHGAIPVAFRKAIGNRIYGCDDCQLVCPWNRYAKLAVEPDFQTRHGLNNRSLVELFNWDEDTFLKNTEGSAIRRIGYVRWLRNIAVALGNAPRSENIIDALKRRQNHPSELVCEHVAWALQCQGQDGHGQGNAV
ncbi:tRNA epoxyqueuosine(34) reductase QueG [Candidatus Spongiihabitans sp.]|uniref:tRNA epoxyqueuosine(34) reductase QueG n=1 Tax=Candidatus Spongiihabitans sp. TaxID=3101308 RepID=UPI003C6EDC1F